MSNDKLKEIGNMMAFPLYTVDRVSRGLTKREYIATQLLSGAITHSTMGNNSMIPEVIRLTDLLLIELNRD
jgi:hypothetical protein